MSDGFTRGPWRFDMDVAPVGESVLAWWPKIGLDEDGETTDEVVGGIQTVTQRMGVGSWNEPDSLNASGDWFGDDFEFATAPAAWQALGPDPVFPAKATSQPGAA